ncbi:hypothetical protein B6927_08915, partial [Campylobacter jejuni]|nr:hypothetical protein [Campylobacter jejuni]
MDYKKQIKTFLEDEENYSLFINGSWGVGKTYLWKEIENEINLKNDQKEFYNRFKSNFNFFNHILLLIEFIKTYGKKFLIFIVDYFSFCYFDKCKPKPIKKNIVYISLFGKEHYKEILEEVTLKTYNYKKILYFLRNLTFWKISIGAFLQFFIKNDFKNLIICFDDLERKSDKLSIKDILGLINQLKEEKCKVILISNENELSNDKEIFDAYKEKSLDLNIHIHSKAEVISQILKEKSPEILKEIIPSLVYKIDNLRTLNKIIKAFKIFNKELEFSQNLNQEKNYKDLFELVLEKVVLRFENIKINDIEQKYIHINYTSKQIIDDIIQNYFDNANYFISNDKKENFKKELKNFKFYVDLAKLKNLLKNSIQYPNE